MMKSILIAGLTSLLATGVLAHSPLSATTPPDQATLAAAPDALSLTFKGTIRLTRVTSVHAGGPGTKLDLGDQTNFATDFVVPFAGMGPGAYVIEWRGLGADGHALKGTFSFTVE